MSVPSHSPRNVLLIGYRGSGKTTVGRLLAQHLRWTHFDTDQHVIQTAGQSIKDIFHQHGEAHFRALESQAVARVATLTHHVISLGGGAVLAKANRPLIGAAGHAVIYLRADPQSLLGRIRADPDTAATRPNLTALAGGVDEIAALLAHREPIYRELATAEVDVSHLTPRQVVHAVLQLI